jgi:hypothetical protein
MVGVVSSVSLNFFLATRRIAGDDGTKRRHMIALLEEFRLVFFLRAVGMTNICGLVTPERVLSDVRSMIADPLQGASNEDEVHVTWHEFRVQSGSFGKLFTGIIG